MFLQFCDYNEIQIAVEKFSEATVGYRESREIADTWVQLFSTPYFMVTPVRSLDSSISFVPGCKLAKLLPSRIAKKFLI